MWKSRLALNHKLAKKFATTCCMPLVLLLMMVLLWGVASASNAFSSSGQLNLIQDMLESYDRKAKPTWDNEMSINVTFSMDLYQILELNEPQQFILLNAWIIERWYDEFLFWNPLDYSNITELRLPYDVIWTPDTTLYNSLVMKDDDTRRLLNAKLTTNVTRRAVLIDLLYPAIFKFSCLLTLRYFPYDLQVCTMTFSSWTYDKKGIDYYPYSSTIGTSNFLENEGWYLLQTLVKRVEVKYPCCANKYTLLKLTLYLRRKPLFYLINLIIPTSIITLIAIVGFFTTSSASGMREEKVSLGITTLLSMSILMLMVSDQMPTTSTFIPLIGWFILCMIILISMGTLASTVVIAVQKRGRLGERLSQRAVHLTRFFAYLSFTELPFHLSDEMKKHEKSAENGKANLNAKIKKPAKLSAFHSKSLTRQEEKSAKNQACSLSSASNDVRQTMPTFSSLWSSLDCIKGRQQHAQARNRLVPDKSTDFLVTTEGGALTTSALSNSHENEPLSRSGGGTVLIDDSNASELKSETSGSVFSSRYNTRTAKQRKGSQSARSTMKRHFSIKNAPNGSLPNSALGRANRTDETFDISALIASNLFASSVVAAPPDVRRLSMSGLFEEADEHGEENADGYASPNAADQFANTVLQMSGRTTSQRHSVFSSTRTNATTPAQHFVQQARTIDENVRRNRLLAQKEYEWTATVLERCFFIVFVIVFFVLTFGINLIGYEHWSDIDNALKRQGDERHI